MFKLAAMLGVLLVVVGLSACGGSVQADRFMVKYSGTLQCQPSATTQKRLDVGIAGLIAAGAVVNGGRCVLDGLPYAAMCGASSGEAFEVAMTLDTVPVAKQLGFESVDRYPDRKPLACS